MSLSEGEQDEIDRRLALIERDPTVDHVRTFDYPRPPLILRLFDDGVWQMIYYLPDEATVAVMAIANALDHDRLR